jgi:hypothetical protein
MNKGVFGFQKSGIKGTGVVRRGKRTERNKGGRMTQGIMRTCGR